MKPKTVSILLILISGVVAIIGYLFLPDAVIVQCHSDGCYGYMPKAVAVLIPLCLSIGGAVGYARAETHPVKVLFLSGVGLFISVLSLVINL